MCGIFGYVGHGRDAAAVVFSGLRRLEYRGYDSWGVAVANGASVAVDKRVGKIGGASAALPESDAGLGHTRWATHGGVTVHNAHPHVDCGGRLAIVHNGIVSNHAELRRELRERGHRFRSETDSELIAHLVEEALAATQRSEGPLLDATRAAHRKLRGLNAIAVLDAQTGELTAAKNGSPLVVGFADAGFFLASDAASLLHWTRRVAFVRDGEAVHLRRGGARVVDVQTGSESTANVTTVDWTSTDAELGAHPDFMTKEIAEQPDAIRRLARMTERADAVATEVRRATDVFVIGCGSAWHAALSTEYFWSAVGRRVTAVPASEFSRCVAFVEPGTLVVALSQSGETVDVLDAAGTAQERGARILAVTNVEGSSLWRSADLAIPLGVGPERCVLSTKAFTAKLALGFLSAHTARDLSAPAAAAVERAASDVEGMLHGRRREALRAVAESIVDEDHLFVIGRGPSYPLSLEAALKIKEVSYVHAEGFAGGELKHGVIALVERGTPCVVLAPNDDTLADTLSNAHQVKARGATVIGVSPQAHDVFDHHIEVADVGGATAILNAVTAQIVGYDLAKLRGCDPDMPRNLAKSVTVK